MYPGDLVTPLLFLYKKVDDAHVKFINSSVGCTDFWPITLCNFLYTFNIKNMERKEHVKA